MRVVPVVSGLAIGVAVLSGVAFTQLAQADDMVTFTVSTSAEYSAGRVDLNEEGRSPGDMRLLYVPFTGENGVSGTMSGFATIVDIPDGEDTHIDAIGSAVFSFGDQDSIVATFKYELLPDGQGTKMDGTQLQPVIGGTGKFIGAKGQVSVSEDASGAWVYTFELLD